MSSHQNDRAVTQADVARHAGVSRSIVSYVVNNGPRKISEDTRNRVLASIKELAYRPNKHAQLLSSTAETIAEKYIGIVLASNYMFKRPYYGSILASIHECASERDFHIRFVRVFNDFSNPVLFNELIHSNEISGVILLGLDQVLNTPDDENLIDEIIRRVEHVVCVEWEWQNVPSILFDRQNAAYQATKHLIDAGRRQIAYIGPDDKRVQGYRQALWERGITTEENLLRYAIDSVPGYEGCQQLLQTGLSIDGICTGTDEVAMGVLSCLHKQGIQVPEDISVASIDNLDFSAFTIPALTTVDVPRHDIGLHAVDLLTSPKAQPASAVYTITMPTQLIVRESSIPR